MNSKNNQYSKTCKITSDWDIRSKLLRESFLELKGADLNFRKSTEDKPLLTVDTNQIGEGEKVAAVIANELHEIA